MTRTVNQKHFFYLILLFTALSSIAQTSEKKIALKSLTPDVNTFTHKLGDKVIKLTTFQYGSSKDIVYVSLHDDEITSVNSVKRLLERQPGLLIKIENNRTRNVKFRLNGRYYTFDPNRMFSRVGIIQTLTMFGSVNIKAVDEIEKFADKVLQLIPENPGCIIALHNNTNGKFSVNSYLPGNIREKDAKKLFINPEEDPDDVFLTTDSVLFGNLSFDNYNTILQDNENAKKDGSLSIYCGEKGIRYVNCETEHGHDIQYQQMIMLVTGHAQKKETEVVAYNYKLMTGAGSFSPRSNTEILFGDKKVGFIRSVTTDSSWATVGKLEITKDFPLYSNMDFLFFPYPASSPRFEVRIDPTRERELLDPSKTVVKIKAGD